MDSPPKPPAGAAYFCVARGTKILHSHNPARDPDLDAVAGLCLESAPPYHSWYSHTAGGRTFGFLVDDDGYTYFAIVDSSSGGGAALPVLHDVRDGFRKGKARNGVHDELMPVLRSLRSSLESMSRPPTAPPADEGDAEASAPTTTKAPLLGRNCSRASRTGEPRSGGGDDRAVKIDMPPPEAAPAASGVISLQKSLSGMKSRGVQTGRRLWWRHVKIVIVADLLLCLVLFGVWMAICRGFQCVSTSG